MGEQSKGNGGQSQEISMEKRLLLAFLLMGAVLFLTPYFYQPPQPPPQNETTEAPAQPAPEPEAPPAAEPAAPEAEQAELPAGAVTAEAEETFTIETEVYRVTFSNRGAVVTSWILKNYTDGEGKPLELVNQRAVAVVGYPFQLDFLGSAPALDPNAGLFAVTRSDDGLGVEFRFSDGVTYYRKAFRFRQDEYICDIESEARHQGAPLPHLLVWRGGFGDLTVPVAPKHQHTLYYSLTDDKLIVNDPDEAEDGPITVQGSFSFAGIEDAYFAAVALPGDAASFTIRTYTDSLPYREIGAEEGQEQEMPHAGAGIGGAGLNRFPLFVGPKDLDLLKQIDPRLQQIVDFGWFSFLAKPLFLVLKWVYTNWIQNYGWAIVIVTVGINILMFPLKLTSLKSMKKMQALQPEVKRIQEKYKGISMRDPRKQKQNEELMALYQKHGVNPMGGCLPMILQIPFFIAFYKVLTVAIELRGADWLWVTDLSQPEHLPIRILPVAMVISQFLMQKMTPTTAVGSSGQQRIMYMMPLMMGFIFYGVSSGLVLYWLTSNVVGVAQQLIINRMGEKVEIPAEKKPEPKPKRKGRKR